MGKLVVCLDLRSKRKNAECSAATLGRWFTPY